MGCFLLNLNKYVMSHDPVYLFEGNYWPRKKEHMRMIFGQWIVDSLCLIVAQDIWKAQKIWKASCGGCRFGWACWVVSTCSNHEFWVVNQFWTRSCKSKWFQMLEIWKCFSTRELHRATTQFQGIFRVQSTPGCSVSWLHGNLKVTFQPERVALSTLQVLCVDGHGFAW